jgi:calmodulin
MSRITNVADAEALLIQKVSEKHSLNRKDVKKAFSIIDSDGDGLLDLRELSVAFKVYMNGIEDKHITALIEVYDVNGDGKISYEELLHCLTHRVAAKTLKEKQHIEKDKRKAQPQIDDETPNISEADDEDVVSSSSRDVTVSEKPSNSSASTFSSSTHNHHINSFMTSLRSLLVQQAQLQRRAAVGPPRLAQHTPQYYNTVAREIISKAFQKYTEGASSAGRRAAGPKGVEYADFAKVIACV